MKKLTVIFLALMLTTSCAMLSQEAHREAAFYDDDGTTLALFREDGNPLNLLGEREFSINITHTNDDGTTTTENRKFTVTKNTIGNMWSALIGFITGLFAKTI